MTGYALMIRATQAQGRHRWMTGVVNSTPVLPEGIPRIDAEIQKYG